MPFTKTPIQSSFQTKPIPLMYEWETRDTTNNYDTDAVNTVCEPVQNQGDPYFNVLKRDGLSSLGLTFAGVVLGIFAPTPGVASYKSLIVVTTTNTYQCNVFAGVWSIANNQAIAIPQTTYMGFTEFLFDNGSTKLYFYSAGLYELTYGGAVVNIAAAPSALNVNPYPVFLNGTLYLSDQSGNIWGSALNDPTTWPASNVATAESYPDPIKAIARVGSYIVVFGSSSIEWFYDAGNPTGTPLQVYVGATRHIGFLGGLVEKADSLLFVGAPEQGQPSVYQINGLKAEPIPSFPFSRWVSGIRQNPGAFGIGTVVGMNGHDVYFYNSFSTSDTPSFASSNSYGVDLDTKLFARYTFQAATAFTPNQATRVRSSTGILPIVLMTFVATGGVVSRGVYQVLPTNYQDDLVNFPVSFTTRNLDFGTRRNKFGSRFLLYADQPSTASSVNVSWSVNDYQTFSTPRPINLNDVYPSLWGIGMFKKIAVKLTYSDNFPMRFSMIEFDYDQGNA